MIICNQNFDMNKVISLDGDNKGMREYAISLMPERYRHNTALVSNQLYYMNTVVLKSKEITQEKKNSLSDTLVDGIQVCGYIDQIISIQGLERMVNEKKLYKFYERDNKI